MIMVLNPMTKMKTWQLLPMMNIWILLCGIGSIACQRTPFLCSSSSDNSFISKWQCGDGYCIGRSYVCDGRIDCYSGNDEFNCEFCRGASFHCENKRCIERSQHCNGISECKDGSDEPPSCPGIISFPDFNDIFNNPDFNTENVYGASFGYIAGIIILIFGIITAIGATIIVCACKKSCPLYKWRKRRQEPPVGVIVAEPNQLYQDELPNESGDQKDVGNFHISYLSATHTQTGT